MQDHDPRKFDFYFEGTNGKGILLIHGITGTPTEMRSIARGLNKAGYSVLCNTLPRHCSTLKELKKVTWQEIYAACVRDFEELSRNCNQVFVGGLSVGAIMAVHLARNFPDKVRGVVALAPTLFYDGWALHKGKFLLELFWGIPWVRKNIDIREGHPYGLKDQTLRSQFQRFYTGASVKKFSDQVLLFGSPFFPLACLYQHHLFVKVAKKEFSQVKVPILILHAREDDMTSLKNAQHLYNYIGSPDKTLVVLEDSYHMITIDQEKDKVVREMANFLGRI